MQIGFLILTKLRFSFYKMAANGGRHFEINTCAENYKTQLIFQNHADTYTFDKCDVRLLYK